MITSEGHFGDMFMLLWCQCWHRPGSKWLRVACCEACTLVLASVPHRPKSCNLTSEHVLIERYRGVSPAGPFSRVRCHWVLVLDLWCFVDDPASSFDALDEGLCKHLD